MAKTVTPALGLDSFSCPHCGALAQQYWYRCWIDNFEKGVRPEIFEASGVNRQGVAAIENDDERARVIAFVGRLDKNELTFRNRAKSPYTTAEMMNMSLSYCHSCDGFAIWVKSLICYPNTDAEHLPQEDMPPEVKADFKEAADIF
jgi:hypothetical protein